LQLLPPSARARCPYSQFRLLDWFHLRRRHPLRALADRLPAHRRGAHGFVQL